MFRRRRAGGRLAARLCVAAATVAAVDWGFVPGAAAVPFHPGLAAGTGPPADLRAQRAAGLDRSAPRSSRLPSRILVLLVDFPDRPGPASAPAGIDSLFFGSTGSVRDYYRRASFGRLALEGCVVPWLRLPQSYAYYADSEHAGLGVRGTYPRNARRMVEDAVRAADPRVDFASFDDDGPDGIPASGDDDGLVDALVVLHAGKAGERGDSREILSHTWTTPSVVSTADGVGAYRYSTVALDSPIGTCAHEFGHLLGLPDLYQSGSIYGLGGGLGSWSLMAFGSWLGDGLQPSDLDAPSKLELGFVDAIVPDANTTSLPLRSARDQTPGTVYRIWTHGRAGLEFFVVENRQPRGQDAALPGGGMLVYHVDLGAANNDDPARPRVALLQADGRSDIERRINNGDPDDPYPGVNARLDAATSPSTRARDTSDTQIRIEAISAPAPNMSFDLQVETTPCIVVVRSSGHERAGDGDGMPEAGEAIELEIVLRNLGLPTGPLAVQGTALVPDDVAWTRSDDALPALAKHDSATVHLVLTPRAGLPDPYGLPIDATLDDGSWSDSVSLVLGIGEKAGFQTCFRPVPSVLAPRCDAGEGEWSVESQGHGTWLLETRAGDLGSVYRSASGARYANNADVSLVSPTFLFAPGTVVRVLHAYEVEDSPGGLAPDGGRIECAVDGGAWEPLEPRAGYPRQLRRESVPYLAGTGVFSGTSPRRWDEFDLPAERGSARLRFRFVSGDSVGASGWEIARVEVGAESEQPAGARLELVAEPNPVRLPARVAFRTSAPLTWTARPTTLGIYDPRGRLVRSLAHEPAPAESGQFVWDGRDTGGRDVASGIYFARLDWGGARSVTKLVVLR